MGSRWPWRSLILDARPWKDEVMAMRNPKDITCDVAGADTHLNGVWPHLLFTSERYQQVIAENEPCKSGCQGQSRRDGTLRPCREHESGTCLFPNCIAGWCL
jgi:hypothetical protein